MENNGLDKLVEDALAQPKGADIEWVRGRVRRRLYANQGLLDELAKPLIDIAIYRRIYDARHNDKRHLKRTLRGPDVIDDVLTGLLETWRFGSKLLKDATKEELLAEAASEYEIAAGHTANGHFYRALAGRLKAGQAVGEAVKSESAAAMWAEIAEREAGTT